MLSKQALSPCQLDVGFIIAAKIEIEVAVAKRNDATLLKS